jgi:exodeoxyribonuclease V alpha subunit
MVHTALWRDVVGSRTISLASLLGGTRDGTTYWASGRRRCKLFDGRSVTYGFGELDMLVPAYAATIHKSQGSEYPAVIIPVLTQHYVMLQRNLLYTGVTRGKRLVVLVGQKKAVAIAVRNASGRRRWSKLAELLSGTAPKR